MDLRFRVTQVVFVKQPDFHLTLLQQSDLQAFADEFFPKYNQNFAQKPSAGHAHDSKNSNGRWSVGFKWEKNPMQADILSLVFVSPEFDFGQNSEWRSQVAHHLNKVTELVAHRNDSCIAHVHISPKAETGWSLEQLRRVAQAVLYFRMAFDIILAPTRKASTAVTIYTREYSDFDTWCERIQNCVDADDLVSWMRLPLHQGFGWDFENAKEDGTIDFRTARTPLTDEQISIWIEIAVSFVKAAAQYGTKDILQEEHTSSLAELKVFIIAAEFEDMNDRGLVESKFKTILDARP